MGYEHDFYPRNKSLHPARNFDQALSLTLRLKKDKIWTQKICIRNRLEHICRLAHQLECRFSGKDLEDEGAPSVILSCDQNSERLHGFLRPVILVLLYSLVTFKRSTTLSCGNIVK